MSYMHSKQLSGSILIIMDTSIIHCVCVIIETCEIYSTHKTVYLRFFIYFYKSDIIMIITINRFLTWMESYGNHTDVDGKPLEFHQNKILCFAPPSRLFGNEIFDIYAAPKDKGKLIYYRVQFCEASNFPFRS